MAHLEDILKKPLITEKTSILGEKSNKYGFIVDLKANKNQIRNAVETLYDVKVVSIRTSILPGKLKRAGRFVKKTTKSKKAYIKLAEGQKIEFFKGV